MSEGTKKKGCNWVVVLVVVLVGIPVALTGIAILASVAVPVYSVVQARAARTKALANAKQIHYALSEYAIDHDGVFPAGTDDSNSAYRQLFEYSTVNENLFYVPGCAYHKSLPAGQTKPDGVTGTAPAFSQALERGENHWAYCGGRNNGLKGNLPIMADGFSTVPGQYSDNPQERGGVWEGEAAIVVRVDGSASMEKPDGSDLRVYERSSGQKVDIFSADYGTDPSLILNPL